MSGVEVGEVAVKNRFPDVHTTRMPLLGTGLRVEMEMDDIKNKSRYLDREREKLGKEKKR